MFGVWCLGWGGGRFLRGKMNKRTQSHHLKFLKYLG